MRPGSSESSNINRPTSTSSRVETSNETPATETNASSFDRQRSNLATTASNNSLNAPGDQPNIVIRAPRVIEPSNESPPVTSTVNTTRNVSIAPSNSQPAEPIVIDNVTTRFEFVAVGNSIGLTLPLDSFDRYQLHQVNQQFRENQEEALDPFPLNNMPGRELEENIYGEAAKMESIKKDLEQIAGTSNTDTGSLSENSDTDHSSEDS